MIDEMVCCANCKYWYPYNEKKVDELGDGAEGECRRYPPSVPVIETDNPDKNECSLFDVYIPLIMGTPLMTNPFSFAGEWCGEFKLMDNPRWIEQ